VVIFEEKGMVVAGGEDGFVEVSYGIMH